MVRPEISDADVPFPRGKWEKQSEQVRKMAKDWPGEKKLEVSDPIGGSVDYGDRIPGVTNEGESGLLWVEGSAYRYDCCASVSAATSSDGAWETAREWEYGGKNRERSGLELLGSDSEPAAYDIQKQVIVRCIVGKNERCQTRN